MTHALHHDRTAHHPAAGWKDALGRAGLVGKGVLYATIALLALQLALGSPEGDTSSRGAIAWIAGRPFGQFLLVLLTGSLFALAAWRAADVVVGDPVEGDEAKDRVRFAGQAVIYLALAVASLKMTIAAWGGPAPSGGSGDGEAQRRATGVVLDWPGGRWIVAAVGLAVIGYAAVTFWHHAVESRFTKRLSTDSGPIVRMGQVGYGARSVVFAVVGLLLLQAAITYDPNEAGGLSAALQELAGTAWGPWLLGALAVGLFAFGAFCVAEAATRTAA